MDGKTKVYGVMGDPIEHSMSPLMHNFYAERTGTDLVYVPFHVNRGTVEMAVKGAFALNIQGMNVTVPHKQDVMKCLEAIDSAFVHHLTGFFNIFYHFLVYKYSD